MRVAYVITRADDIGGAQIHVRDLSKALALRGHEPVVISGAMGPLSDQLQQAGVPYRQLPHLVWRLHALDDPRAFLELRRALQDIGPDLVSAHSSKAGILARLACRSLDLPVIYTAHGWSFGPTRSFAERVFHRTAERLAAPLSDRIITVCEADRRLAIQEHVFRPDRSITIHNGVPDLGADCLAKPVVNPPRLVMVARFAPPKDHATLLEALRDLKQQDWTLDLVGTGPTELLAREMVNEFGLAERVRFLGYRPDVPEVLARAQAFILSSTSEGFPRSILEAMRAGLPVVAPHVGGIRESVYTGRNGFVVPVGDSAALRDRLSELIQNPQLRKQMGRNSRQLYVEEFTFERMMRRTLKLYEEVLVSRGR